MVYGATPTPEGNLHPPMPMTEGIPRASAEFAQPKPHSGAAGFILKKFVRKFSGLTGSSSSPVSSASPASPTLLSPAVDAQGNRVLPSPKKSEKCAASSERKKFGSLRSELLPSGSTSSGRVELLLLVLT